MNVRWDNQLIDMGVKVIKVIENSPADLAGIRENIDYILGDNYNCVQSISDFDKIIRNDQEKTELFILDARN